MLAVFTAHIWAVTDFKIPAITAVMKLFYVSLGSSISLALLVWGGDCLLKRVFHYF